MKSLVRATVASKAALRTRQHVRACKDRQSLGIARNEDVGSAASKMTMLCSGFPGERTSSGVRITS